MGGRALYVVEELELIERSTGDRPATCPWWSFFGADVADVLHAYDCIAGECGSDELLRQWWGDDPPLWLVLGLRHYRRVLDKVHAESIRLARKHPPPRAPSPPKGHEVLFRIED